MRQSGKNTRQRGRGGRRNNNFGQINRNTTLDSNGPDVRLRGNAQQLHEKYTSLGNESSAAGERITAEAYYQYADHYFRVHSTIMANMEDRRQSQQQPPLSSGSSEHEDNASKASANGRDNDQSSSSAADKATAPDAADDEGGTGSDAGTIENNDDKDKDQPSTLAS